MTYPPEQIEELKAYCSKLSAFTEGNITYLYLHDLRLPEGCQPAVCDALLCPVPRNDYPSRLFLSVQVTGSYTRNWNVSNERIGENNWFAFSWKANPASPTLKQILLAHLTGFTKEK